MYAIAVKFIAAVGIKGILAAVGIAAFVAAGTWFVMYQRQIGRDAAIAVMVKETAEESERRMAVVEESLKNAEAKIANLQNVENDNAALRQQIETLSARNDAVDCLDAAAVERLRRGDGGDRR